MNSPVIVTLSGAAGGLIATALLGRQCRRPTGIAGQFFARLMNLSHSSLTTWGLSHVTISDDAHVLDIGCGGGATVARLATMVPRGHVTGVDIGTGSLAVARRVNASNIASGRVDIREDNVADLTFADGTFDLVTAIETHYYWPDLARCLTNVHRVTKAGGRAVLIVESYQKEARASADRAVMQMLGGRTSTAASLQATLLAAGFAEVRLAESRSRGWLCAVATRA